MRFNGTSYAVVTCAISTYYRSTGTPPYSMSCIEQSTGCPCIVESKVQLVRVTHSVHASGSASASEVQLGVEGGCIVVVGDGWRLVTMYLCVAL